MRKLIFANLNRLWLNKPFWWTVILMACTEGLIYLLLLGQNTIPMDYPLFIPIQLVGIVTSVFISLFLGSEYSDGTIRNKLIVGHKRSSIYLASLIVGIVAVTIIYLTGVLSGAAIGSIYFAPPDHSIDQIIVAGVVGWMACIAYISIFNIIGMLSSSKAKTSIICILTAFFLMFIGLLFYSLVMQGILFGTAKTIGGLLLDFNPFGQTMQIIPIDMVFPWKLATCAMLLTLALTGMGLCAFSKKDIK